MKVEYNSPLAMLLGTISILCAAASWAMGRASGGCCWGDDGDDTDCAFIRILKGTYTAGWRFSFFCVSRFVSTTLEWDVYSDYS